MKKVIFDVDGVLLSEKRYFDVSALTVWEWFYSPSYMRLGHEDVKPDLSNAEIDSIRARIWYDDKILTWLKQHGVNNNWDMVHARIVVTLWLMMEEYVNDHGRANTQIKSIDDVQYLGSLLQGYTPPSADAVYQRMASVVPDRASKDEVFTYLTKAVESSLGRASTQWTPLQSPLWQLHFEDFQEWYFGDDLYEKTYGKKPVAPGKTGFLQREQPFGTPESIKKMFQTLKARGYDIAIATGRSQPEVEVPFKTFHWLEEFNPVYVATYTDVQAAEEQLHMSLDKPNPFAYYLGAFGKYPDRYVDYVNHPEKYKRGTYYVVGDSLADVWCAKAMGAVMIGTLTGLDGELARPMFAKEHVPYVVKTVEDILEILK